jgi:hypothetical protein
MKNEVLSLLDKGHIYLKNYRVIAITIVFFFMIQTYILTEWYMDNFDKLKEWQNVPVVGLIGGYVTALKFALQHILDDSDE